MEWKINLSDPCFDEREARAVAEVVESGWLTMGPRVAEFEAALSRRLDGREVVMVSSATAALHLALVVHDVAPGDEIIIPSLTFAATANVVRAVGARPVFADIISPDEPTIDPQEVARLMTDRTKAIIPVHYACFGCRMAPLVSLCRERGLALIEDAAHAIGGADASGRPLGAIADAGAFSFFSNKNLVTGEGGALAAADAEKAERARRLRCHGMTTGTWARRRSGGAAYDVVEAGWNYRPTEMAAALGKVQLDKFDSLQARRREVYRRYVERLRPVKDFRIPFLEADGLGTGAYHIFPVLAPDEETRDRAATSLKAAGIQTSHHYRPLHQMSAYASEEWRLPKTEDFSARELTLPFHPALEEKEIETICSVLERI